MGNVFIKRLKFANALNEPPVVDAVNLIQKLVSIASEIGGGIPDKVSPSNLIQEGKAVLSSFVAVYLILVAPQDSAGVNQN